MSEALNPNNIFDTAQQGIAEKYWGRDQWGADTWEYIFDEAEVAKANDILLCHGLTTADKITVLRVSELPDVTGDGQLIPGKDEISFQLRSGNILTLISFTKPDSTDDSENAQSEIIQIGKHIQAENNGDDIRNLLMAKVNGINLYEGVEDHLAELQEVSTFEVLAISALTKMLPGNRDSA